MLNLIILLAVLFISSCLLSAEEIKATDAGAMPNSGKDAAGMLQEAFKKLEGQSDILFVFPSGTYNLTGPEKSGTMLNIKGIKNLTITGENVEIINRRLKACFRFQDCENVLVEKLTFDWQPPSFSVGTVIASKDNICDVRIEDEFPVTDGMPVEAFMEYDPATRLPARRGYDIYSSVDSTSLLKPQVLRMKLKRPMNIKVGSLTVLRHRVYGRNAISFSNCRNVRVENVTIYTAPGMGITGQNTENISIRELTVKPRPGTRRIMSTAADATHFNGCYGKITVEDSWFEGMGDDAVNIHGMYHIIEKIEGKTVITRVRNDWIKPPRAGDTLEFTHRATLLPFASDTVKSVTIDHKTRRHHIIFDHALPDSIEAGQALGNVSWAPKTIIRGCTVKNNRARGMLIQTRGGLIENNRYEGCTGAALHITCDLDYWLESIATRDITIRGNTFENCNYGAAMMNGVIMVFAHVPGGLFSPAGAHRGLIIEDNIIRDSDNSGMCIISADDVIIRNNTIDRVGKNPTRTSGKAAIYLENAANVRIYGNKVTPAAEGNPDVLSGPGCACRNPALPKGWDLKQGEGTVLSGGMEVTSPKTFMLLMPGKGSRIEYTAMFPAETVVGGRACELSAVLNCDPEKPYKTGYWFQFGGKSNTATQLIRNKTMIKDNTSPATLVEAGKTYKIIAENKDGLVTVMLNGKEIFRFKDPAPLTGGRCGLYSWGRGARFTNVRTSTR
ncbi:right-handed parallel beta-helix repeat-containing protein [Planctomycetota bacterium]